MKKTAPRRLRNLRAWCLRLDRKQQRSPQPAPADLAKHHCNYCGTDYTGRRCPQCGLTAEWKRFTMNNAFRAFMDIWGLGQRSIFNTMKDFFWRPGYMMSDYLAGHHLSYFPPFKLFALLVTFLTAITLLLDVPINFDSDNLEKLFTNSTFKDKSLRELSPTLCSMTESVFHFFNTHLLYRFLLQNCIITLAAWRVFRSAKHYNLTETFITQVYINCQFFLLAIINLIITQGYYPGVSHPYLVSDGVVFLVLFYDYYQLYGLGFKSTFWRLIKMTMMVYVLLFTISLLIIFTFLVYLLSTGSLV